MNRSNEKWMNLMLGYLQQSGFNVKKEDFRLQLHSDPFFPSFKAMTNTLDYFGIPNMAAMVPKKYLNELPDRFLAILNTKDGQKATAFAKKRKNVVELSFPDGSKKNFSYADFKKSWEGTVLLVEGREKYVRKLPRPSFWIPGAVTLLAMVSLAYNMPAKTLFLFLSSLLGAGLSILIALESLGVRSALGDRTCRSGKAGKACTAIINASQGKLFGGVSLSDAAITYFPWLILILVFFGYDPFLLGMLSMGSLIFVGYSLYSQAFVLKQWCLLCMATAGILLLQALLVQGGRWWMTPDFMYLAKSALLFLLVGAFWKWIKKSKTFQRNKQDSERELLSLKRDPALLQNSFSRKPDLHPEAFSQLPALSFGDTRAPLQLTGILSPSCGFCKDAYETFTLLLNRFGNRISFKLIFNIPVHRENPYLEIAQLIVDQYLENPEKSWASLGQWYALQDLKTWKSSNSWKPSARSLEMLQAQSQWCLKQGIDYTPMVLIGGYQLPKPYRIQDLHLLMEALLEHPEWYSANPVTPSETYSCKKGHKAQVS